MKSKYWLTVGKRLISLTKTALQTAVPVVLVSSIILAINKSSAVIQSRLTSVYKKSVINSLINLIINITAITILYFNPFRTIINIIIAGLLFLSMIYLMA